MTSLHTLTLTESYNTARDVLNVTRERLTQRVQRALENAAGNSEGGAGEGVGETEEGGGGGGRGGSSTTPEVNSALRGVSQKLLEKVKCVIPTCILCMYIYTMSCTCIWHMMQQNLMMSLVLGVPFRSSRRRRRE